VLTSDLPSLLERLCPVLGLEFCCSYLFHNLYAFLRYDLNMQSIFWNNLQQDLILRAILLKEDNKNFVHTQKNIRKKMVEDVLRKALFDKVPYKRENKDKQSDKDFIYGMTPPKTSEQNFFEVFFNTFIKNKVFATTKSPQQLQSNFLLNLEKFLDKQVAAEEEVSTTQQQHSYSLKDFFWVLTSENKLREYSLSGTPGVENNSMTEKIVEINKYLQGITNKLIELQSIKIEITEKWRFQFDPSKMIFMMSEWQQDSKKEERNKKPKLFFLRKFRPNIVIEKITIYLKYGLVEMKGNIQNIERILYLLSDFIKKMVRTFNIEISQKADRSGGNAFRLYASLSFLFSFETKKKMASAGVTTNSKYSLETNFLKYLASLIKEKLGETAFFEFRENMQWVPKNVKKKM
jgi:hypothetical protein